ncbi:MAG: response regulator transcription factor [Candidatus Aureabacteria bacterium]|nr:response regulator transcription factor [Candidatus Auribacterota bacterium]
MARTIIIADDHDIIREGIKNILRGEDAYKIIAESSSGRDAADKVKKMKPDILLLDISMPEMSGLEIIKLIHLSSPKTKILIISVHKSNAYVMKALESGVMGYLQKDNAGEELIPALEKIARGQIYLSSSVSSLLVDKAVNRDKKPAENGIELSSREKDVIRLAAEGKTAKEISSLLCISQRTVENYKNNILKKLGLHRTSDLIKYAIKHNIVDLENF